MKKIAITRLHILSDAVTENQVSTVAECSIANNGPQILVTGNWFAARSLNNGKTWKYMNPQEQFSLPNNRRFCCDQTLVYDKSRDLMCWILQYEEAKDGNTMRLSVKKGKTLDDDAAWDVWDFTPTGINPEWTNLWFDYNHAVLSDNYLYISTNVFRFKETFSRCIVLRISLNSLQEGNQLDMDYFETKDFSLRCVQGAKDTMYFAAHTESVANNLLHVYSWPENSADVARNEVHITPWSAGNKCRAICPDNTNWLMRIDYTITGAWLSNGVLGFMWTANKRGSERPFPHIRVVCIRTADMSVMEEPDIWSREYAYAYPDASSAKNGTVGVSLFMGGGSKFPSHVVGVLNDKANKWTLKIVREGTNGPADEAWGDYLTIRPLSPAQTGWISAAHTLQGGKEQDHVSVHTVQFKWEG